MGFFSLSIPGADHTAAAAAEVRIATLTKPFASLGRIEELAIRLAGIAALPKHGYEKRAVFLAAADHGVAAEGVSAYPSDVTAQMVGGFLAGVAAVNAFARSARAEVAVADFGVTSELAEHSDLLSFRIGPGTANLARGPAMSGAQLHAALEAGVAAAEAFLARHPCELVALGEMGIANTTSAAALLVSLTGASPQSAVGRGTGIDDARLDKKRAIVSAACARVAHEEVSVRIAALGGFEILGLAGAMAKFAAERIPILLDGFIVSVAALVAQAYHPRIADACIASHRSCEPGHALALAHLGLHPLLDLDLRLGEGSGAALVFGLCDAAARMHGEMLTFAEAGVATASAT